MGNSNLCPNIKVAATWCGSWSTDVAENRFLVRKARLKGRTEEQRAPIVDGGVPDVERDRVVAGDLLHRAQPVPHLVECLVPTEAFPGPVRHPSQRMAKPIGIGVDVLEGHRFGTDVAAAERVLPVAPDRPDFVTTDLDGETADRLAQIAGPIMSLDVIFLHRDSSANCTGSGARLQ